MSRSSEVADQHQVVAGRHPDAGVEQRLPVRRHAEPIAFLGLEGLSAAGPLSSPDRSSAAPAHTDSRDPPGARNRCRLRRERNPTGALKAGRVSGPPAMGLANNSPLDPVEERLPVPRLPRALGSRTAGRRHPLRRAAGHRRSPDHPAARCSIGRYTHFPSRDQLGNCSAPGRLSDAWRARRPRRRCRCACRRLPPGRRTRSTGRRATSAACPAAGPSPRSPASRWCRPCWRPRFAGPRPSDRMRRRSACRREPTAGRSRTTSTREMLSGGAALLERPEIRVRRCPDE